MATTKFILRIGLACLSLPVWGWVLGRFGSVEQ
jgi:hypothetical protein